MTPEGTQAKALLAEMLAQGMKRQSIELRLDELERQARKLEDVDRKRTLLRIAGEIRRLLDVQNIRY